jgi:hypothetical protein
MVGGCTLGDIDTRHTLSVFGYLQRFARGLRNGKGARHQDKLVVGTCGLISVAIAIMEERDADEPHPRAAKLTNRGVAIPYDHYHAHSSRKRPQSLISPCLFKRRINALWQSF